MAITDSPLMKIEFWMIEPEVAFAGLEDNMKLAEGLVKHVVDHLLNKSAEEMKFFQERIDNQLMDRMAKTLKQPFKVITYGEAVEILKDAIHKKGEKFEFPVEWGQDLSKEHEKYLVEKAFDGRPVFVVNYPKSLKPFYMKLNPVDDTNNKQTVQAMDLLVPTIGELIGGSVREENYDLLKKR